MYRAFRFVHPDFDERRPGGLQMVPTGIAMVEDEEAIRQSLLLLLSTSPGERVMLPEYGCDLHRLVFSPNDDTTAGMAIFFVGKAIQRWEPRVEVIKIDAGPDVDDASRLLITVDYRMPRKNRLGTLTVPVSLMRGT